MDKKNYQKPNMKVVKLQHTAHLLEGSDKPGSGNAGSREYRSSWDEE
jgi:hypothetical protein